MRHRVRSSLLCIALLGSPALAHADTITILDNNSGIAVLAHAIEGGVDVRNSFPYTSAEGSSREVSASVGTTSTSASASLNSSSADPAHMWGDAATTAMSQSTIGEGDVSGSADFAVRFQLATAYAYSFIADFTASGDLSDYIGDSYVLNRSQWLTSLTRFGTGIGTFNALGFDSTHLERSGVLDPGVYYLLVESAAIGGNPSPGPATINAFSNLRFSFDLRQIGPDPAPVPEPASLVLFGSGLAGVVARARRRRTR